MRVLALILGVYFCSTAVIFIRQSTVDPVLLAAYRLLFASLVLIPVYVRSRRKFAGWYSHRSLLGSLPAAAFLALHFITWIYGARLTYAANASLIVNLLPVAMPFLLYFAVGELVNRREILGTLIAMTGVVVLGAMDFHTSTEFFLGDLVCFGSMLLFAMYLVQGRRNQAVPDVWLYLVPVYAMAGVICLGLALMLSPFGLAALPPVGLFDRGELGPIIGITLVPTVLGHSLINYSLRHLRGQLVAVLNLGQFIFAGIMGYFILDEVPQTTFFLASTLVVVGAVVVIRAMPSPQR